MPDSLLFLHKKDCLTVYGFVIMPNHLHLIWELRNNNGKELPVASFLKFTAHTFEQVLQQNAPIVLEQFRVDARTRRYNFWQPDADWFWLIYIPTIEQKLQYIHNNPLQPRWRLCEAATDYPFSSATFDAAGEKSFGFLQHYSKFVESKRWTADRQPGF